MPLLSGQLDRNRLIVNVGIQGAPPLIGEVSGHAVPLVVPTNHFRGLFDTGAARTCITRRTAHALGLKPRGRILLGNVATVERHRTYIFSIGLWCDHDDNGVPAASYFAFDPIEGADFKDNDDFDILVGMDVITQGDLTIWRTGTYEFSVGRHARRAGRRE